MYGWVPESKWKEFWWALPYWILLLFMAIPVIILVVAGLIMAFTGIPSM